MGARRKLLTGAIALGALAAGCGGESVTTPASSPLTPQQARVQVLDTGRGLVVDLGLRSNLTESTFTYESCTDDNRGPFRGKLAMVFWWPGASRSHPVDPAVVRNALQRHGWTTDPDVRTHAALAMRKGAVTADIDVITADPPPVGHVGIDLYGECRDTTDHSADPFDRGDVTAELQSP